MVFVFSTKERLTRELQNLEQELLDLGDAVTSSQVWHKKNRIEVLKRKIAEINKKETDLKSGTNKLKSKMNQNTYTNMSNDGERE